VERGARDRDAAHVDGCELRHRSQRPRAAHLHLDRLDCGGLLLRGELEGDGPARRAGELAELPLPGEAVHLDHRPVDLDPLRVADLQHVLVVGQDFLRAAAGPALSADEEAPVGQQREHSGLGLDSLRQALADGVGAKLEGAQAVRIDVMELAQRARRGVARVREGLLPALEPPRVQPLEGGDRQRDLAAHRDVRRNPAALGVENQGDAVALAEVRRHVLALEAVAAGRADGEAPLLVHQLHAGAVELRLAHVLHRLVRLQQAPDAFVEGDQLFAAHGIVERQHRDAVLDLGEALGGRGADPLARGVQPRKSRVLAFQLLELAQQPVVLRIGDLRLVQDVVEPAVAVQLEGEFVDSPPDGCVSLRSQTLISAEYRLPS
jgi:hypothetical protein